MPKVDASSLVLAGVSILYPLVAAVAVRTFGAHWVVLTLLALLALRGLLGLHKRVPVGLTLGLLAAAAAVALAALYDRELATRLYPAFINAAMLFAFARTLVAGPSMIERFARQVEPDLPESGVRYTRAVTFIWCGFFVINGAIAIWTALFASWPVWTLYNGVIAYAAIAALLVGEILVRPLFRRGAAP